MSQIREAKVLLICKNNPTNNDSTLIAINVKILKTVTKICYSIYHDLTRIYVTMTINIFYNIFTTKNSNVLKAMI